MPQQRPTLPAANVAQHEFAVVPVSEAIPFLGTKNVKWCTAWCGVSAEGSVAFMAHFSVTACVAASVARIIAEVQRVSPDTTTLHTTLVGGWGIAGCNLPVLTRQRIAKAAERAPFDIDITQQRFSVDPWDGELSVRGLDISMRCADGTLYYDSLDGDLHRSLCDFPVGVLTPASIMS